MIKGQDLEICPKLLSGISDYQSDQPGEVQMRKVTVEENIDRRNYQESDNIDFKDGDLESSVYYLQGDEPENGGMYANSGEVAFQDYLTLISDHARVYKGASWADRIYWANPGTRRYLDERQSTATIGFRCAMVRVGSPVGLGDDKRRSKLKK